MDFSPAYWATITLPDGSYQVRTLQTLNSGLSTALQLGGLDFMCADPSGEIGRVLGRARYPLAGTRCALPNALMAKITIDCRNVWGERGRAWTGFITSAGPAFDAQQGHLYHITAGDALKPFEVQTQSAADVAALTLAGLGNVSASAVLRYAARACGLSPAQLAISVQADAGSGIQTDIPPAVFISPQQSSWLAVLNGVAQFTGNILFADEDGVVQYRPIDYTAPPVRSIPTAVVVQSALADSDEQLYTHTEVRYGVFPVASAAPHDDAPQGWKDQLRDRKFITYMPWLQSTAAAQWAATTILRQAMAQAGVGQVTILGDHAYHVGDTVRLDYAGKDAFIASVQQQWQWGGNWLTVLGLTFVRDSGTSLPTGVQPSKAVLAGFPNTRTQVASPAEQQAAELATTGRTDPQTLTLVATGNASTIPAGYDLIGPTTLFTDGSLVMLQDATTRAPITLGKTKKALSKIAAPASATGQTLTIYDPAHTGATETVIVTVRSVPNVTPGSGTYTPPQTGGAGSAAQQALDRTRNPQPGDPSGPGRYVPATQPTGTTPWRDMVMRNAMKLVGHPYTVSGTQQTRKGTAYSCVAMVWTAMSTSQYINHLLMLYPQDPFILQLSIGLYQEHILANLPGATRLTTGPSDVQQGDILLFSNTMTAAQMAAEGWYGDYDPTTGLTFTHGALALGAYSGPAIAESGILTTFKNLQTAMVTATWYSTGVTIEDYDDPFWGSRLTLTVRPDYST